MTAAPFLEGTYQPRRCSPSLVVSVTSSWSAPRSGAGTSARLTWVVRYIVANGPTSSPTITAATTPLAMRRA